MKRKTKKVFKYLAMEFAGVFAFIIGWQSFIVPNKVGAGGVTGICNMLGHLLNRDDLGSFLFLINLPLLVLSAIFLGKEFCFKTGLTVVLVSFISNMLEGILPEFVGDRLALCVLGAVFMGAGLGLIFKSGGTSGGTDILAKLIKQKFPDAELKWILFGIDMTIICMSAIVYKDISAAVYGGMVSFVYAQVMNMVAYSTNIIVIIRPDASKKQDVFKVLQEVAGMDMVYKNSEEITLLTKKKNLHGISQRVKSADSSALILYSVAIKVE